MNKTPVISNHLRAGIKSSRPTMKAIQLTAALAALLLANSSAWAGNTWSGGGDPDGNWSNGANWDGTPPDYGAALTFAGTTGLNSTNNSAATSLAALFFDPGAGPFVINGSPVTLTADMQNNSTSTQTLNLNLILPAGIRTILNNGGPVVLGGVITTNGTATLLKNGSQRLTLNASGSVYNLFQINGGTVVLGVDNALPTSGNVSGAALVFVGGSLEMNGHSQTTAGAITIGGASGLFTLVDSVGGGVLKLKGNITQNASSSGARFSVPIDLNGATRTFDIRNSSNPSKIITNSGPIINSSGTAGIIKNGAGTLVLSGTNTYNGNTTINGGKLQLDVASLNPGASVSMTNTAVLDLNFNATNTVLAFSINGVSQPSGVYNATTTPGLITGAGALEVASAVSAGFWDGGGANANWSTGANWDANVVPVFPKALTFAGPGGLVNTNDLTGKTVNGITFSAAAGAFVLNGNAITNAGDIGFSGNPSAPITQTINLNLDLGGGDRAINTQPNGDIVLGGVISGSNRLYKNNSGTLTLSGANTFTGDVQVRAGTLKLGANSVLAMDTLVLNPTSVAATVDVNGKTNRVGTLRFANPGGNRFVIDSIGGGVLQITNTVELSTNAGPATISATLDLLDLGASNHRFGVNDPTSTLTVSGAIICSSGSAKIKKTGVGRLVLAGPNTYNGDTTVSQGTLQLDLASLGATNAVYLETNGVVLNLNFSGTNNIGVLYTNGVALPGGLYNASTLPGWITGGGALQTSSAPTTEPGNPISPVVSGGSLTFNITNSTGSYIIEATTNIAIPGSWVGIYTNAAPFSFTDTNAVNLFPQRFYRTLAE